MSDKGKTKKVVLWSILIVVLLAVLLIGAFCFAFVSYNPQFKAASLSDSDYFAGARLTQSVLFKALRSKDEKEVRILKISNREMQSVMRLSENADTLLYLIGGVKPKTPDGKNTLYKLHYDKGVLHFRVRLTDVFLKMCLVGHGQAKIKYENGKLEIDFITLKVGRFELPEKYKQMVKDGIYSYLKENSVYDIVRSSVLKVDFVEHGNVRIYYLPHRLRRHVKNTFVK